MGWQTTCENENKDLKSKWSTYTMSYYKTTNHPVTTQSIQAHWGLFFPQCDARFATKQEWYHFMRVDVSKIAKIDK